MNTCLICAGLLVYFLAGALSIMHRGTASGSLRYRGSGAITGSGPVLLPYISGSQGLELRVGGLLTYWPPRQGMSSYTRGA